MHDIMSSTRLPTLFVSHGAPTLILEDVPARVFLQSLGTRFPGMMGVLCISAHWNLDVPAVNAVEHPETIHDFYGFPQSLYRMKYPARGSPSLAGRVAGLLDRAGITCTTDTARGLDHGTWVPMMLMFPGADVPVVQLSIQRNLDTARHLALGEAIAGLRDEGILVMGSGGAVHPLGDPIASLGEGASTEAWAEEFNDWLADAVIHGDRDSLIGYRELAPHALRAHPYPDHFMPILAALGAAGPGARGTVIHHSWNLGDLGMDAYTFD
ncbi:DODA-type extradiol aromatic ring-opening family dioxygenase [Methanoregula sp.]|uniref:DODA-type extradiol aromatic ring-opening family dioxygenase n=1 Tax=Methanoregula sp. TaxID=2052170 RepID=UPI003C77CBE0